MTFAGLGRAARREPRGEAGDRPHGHRRVGPGRAAGHRAGHAGHPPRRLGPALPARRSDGARVVVPRGVGERAAGPARRARAVHGVAGEAGGRRPDAARAAADVRRRVAGPRVDCPRRTAQALLAFQQKAGELQRAMMGASAAADEALRNIRFMKKALVDTPRADPKLGDQLRAIEKRLRAALVAAPGRPASCASRSEATPPSLMDRVSGAARIDQPDHRHRQARLRHRRRRLREAAARD